MSADLKHADQWVFDLDNTLYPAECDLFAQIDVRMTQFVSQALKLPEDEARRLQKQYYAEHGTTLNGMMQIHGVDPAPYLDFVHDIDLTPIPELLDLRDAVRDLPGRKYIFTNGSKKHADRVVTKLGLDGLFDGYFGIEDAGYEPKPRRSAFDKLHARFDIKPQSAVMFEDLSRNLKTAHDLGYTTVLVHSDKDWSHEPEGARPAGAGDAADHIHHLTDCLTTFLKTAQKTNKTPSE
ncbi:MAG: pyrimidine 5'-nucleotidase [Hyphomonadaceae bacterium TMED5]|nr:MAG: pyrimidine 5'-nucleotidase [Hyphomonadaceae bacterium TMED5]|tara:strand:- start:22573 stop:23283 length:711 start_codon:yes stop_codon:yes gene_type:complete